MRNASFYTLKIIFLAIALLPAQQPMTAEEAIRLGLENNYAIRIARNNAEIAGNNRGLGTAGFLPRLDAAGGASYSESRQETNSPFSFGDSESEQYNGRIELTWTLFDGFSMFASKGRFDALATAGEASARLTIENSVVSILSAYFNVVQQQQLYDVARENLAISADRLSKEEVRRDIGGASSTDLLRAQVAFNADQSTLLQQELALQTARQNLNTLLARDPATEFEIETEIQVAPLGLSAGELNDLARERNAALQAARASLQAADDNIAINSANFYPRLAFNGSYTYTDRRTPLNSDNPQFPSTITSKTQDTFVGLSLSWNLFNGMRDNLARQNAVLTYRNSLLEKENSELQLKANLALAITTFEKRMQLLQLEQQNLQAAQQNFELQKERYAVGTVSSLEFRDAQINLNRAQIALIAARYQARVARLNVEQLTGQITIR